MKINYKEIIIVKACPFCGHAHEVAVNECDYWAWEDGELAQNAFPYLSADEREILISGICPRCWAETFGENDDEGEEDETADDVMEQLYINEAAEAYGGEEPPEPKYTEEEMQEALHSFMADVLTALFGGEVE